MVVIVFVNLSVCNDVIDANAYGLISVTDSCDSYSEFVFVDK